MTPRKDRPQRAVVHFRGITYEMDILAREHLHGPPAGRLTGIDAWCPAASSPPAATF